MKRLVLLTGASGFLGKLVKHALEKKGWKVLCARRVDSTPLEHGDWNTQTGEVSLPARPLNAVVNLAGRSITASRWTDKEKQRLLDSRVDTTNKLVSHLTTTGNLPDVWINASGIGIYGSHGEEWIDESTPAADTFMGQMATQWEKASQPLEKLGSRTVYLRFSMILGPYGGAWPRMKIPFQLGIGGIIGSGRQYWSWVHYEDVLSLITSAIEDPRYQGSFNATSPNPVTNRDFTKVVGAVLGKPTFIPLPEFAVSLIFGEMGKELFLSSQRCHSAKLNELGFTFRFGDLEKALRHFN